MNGHNTSETSLPGSTSSPSVLAPSDRSSPPPSHWTSSPPPTSASFSSFQTFGVNGDVNGNGMKIKSYGFSGSSGMRDGDYMRKVKKSASGRHLNGSENGTPTKGTTPLPAISPEKANAWYDYRLNRPDSPETSEGTATPTSLARAAFSPASRNPRTISPSPSSSLDLPPQPPLPRFLPPPTPDSADYQPTSGRPQRKRQSLLAGLSQAQMKRISMALEEIEGKLQKGPSNGMLALDEQEEMLEKSSHPMTTSLLPFLSSPSSKRAIEEEESSSYKPDSSSKLPASPRSRNLVAHVQDSSPPPAIQPILLRSTSAEPEGVAPRPILTPSRTQPLRHMPKQSASSSSSQIPVVPCYIPGQPRPVRATHRSEGSISSQSVSSASRPISSSSVATSTSVINRSRSDSTPSPVRGPVTIAPRTSSLARSKSVSQSANPKLELGVGGPSRTSGQTPPPSQSAVRNSGNSVLGEHLIDRRLSSPFSVLPPTPAETIEEDDETSDPEHDIGSRPFQLIMPEIKPVWSRRSVADSRRESESDVQRAQSTLGSGRHRQSQTMSRSVSQEGTIESSAESSGPSRAGTPTITLRRQRSEDSLGSSFARPTSDEIRFGDSCPDSPITPNDNDEEVAQMLRKLSGVTKEELVGLQVKLVERAKQEREALRGASDESPLVPVRLRNPSCTS